MAASRRDFLRTSGWLAASLATTPDLVLAQAASTSAPWAVRPVRVRGRVRTGTAGLSRVPVTDGTSVVVTDAEGYFELVTTDRTPQVSVSLPRGFRVPTQAAGTSRLHQAVQADAKGEAQLLFDLERRPEADDRHAFFVLADPQTQDETETGYFNAQTVPDVAAQVRGLNGRPAFGVGCGDLMYDRLELFPEYDRGVTAMGLPFFQVVGNHDLDMTAPTDEASTATFRARFGPTHYSFDMGEVHYVVLDDVHWLGKGYVGYVDERQLRWLASDLALVERGRTVVVFLHIPAFCTLAPRTGLKEPATWQVVSNRQALYELLAPYKAHLMSGHTHECEHVFEGGVHEHVHGAVCGAWWTGPVATDGSPNGYGIYHVDGSTLRWQYKATGQPIAHQMRVYAPTSGDHLLRVNIWNHDPQWQTALMVDGEPRGPLTQRTGLDPLASQLQTGSALPAKRPWVDPIATSHLFEATLPAEWREARVRVTDRFRETYEERIARG